jgi:5-carboxymethyl-2-hydroxymuconic-semialdehyde dehydrogenase
MSDLSTHLAKLETHLARYRENGILNLIDGKDATATETFETRSPVDESLICSVARGTAADVNAAARAAKAAFPAWAATSGEARKKILHRIADLIVERAEEIALCECWDTGQAYRFMSKAALRGAENFRFYADRAPGARDGQSLPTKSHDEHHQPQRDRPGRRHHPVEHALHAVHLEDRAGSRSRLHGGAQARRIQPVDRPYPRRDRR